MSALQDRFRSFLDRHPDLSVVCFDFFDTLVARTVAPEQTKRLASRQLAVLLGDYRLGERIYTARHDLEARMCREKADRGMDPEFGLPDFAGRFHEHLLRQFPRWPGALTESLFRDLFIDMEIAVEKRVQRVAADGLALLKMVPDRGIRAVLVSDFYLPRPYFDTFLDFHDLARYFEDIVVSCDYGLSKASGRLYPKLLERLNSLPKQLAMVGDNEHADVKMARANGLSAFHIDRHERRDEYRRWMAKEASRKRDGRRLSRQIDAAVGRHGGIHFPEAGIALWRFTFYLFQRLVRNGVQNVFFLFQGRRIPEAPVRSVSVWPFRPVCRQGPLSPGFPQSDLHLFAEAPG